MESNQRNVRTEFLIDYEPETWREEMVGYKHYDRRPYQDTGGMTWCPGCKGLGKAVCATCSGEGDVKCRCCSERTICDACDGDMTLVCDRCEGRGEVPASSITTEEIGAWLKEAANRKLNVSDLPDLPLFRWYHQGRENDEQ